MALVDRYVVEGVFRDGITEGITRAGASVERASARMEAMGRGLGSVERSFTGAGIATAGFGQEVNRVNGLVAALSGGALLALGRSAIQAGTTMDSARLSLAAVSGSASEASIQLERLEEISRLPGIGLEEAVKGSVRLQLAGQSAQEAERALRAFGNAVALTGGGKGQLDQVTYQLGQLAQKGKVLSQDLRPIIEAAPAVGRALREAFGTVDPERIQSLGLSMDVFLDRLVGAAEKLPQVSLGGLRNQFENLETSTLQAGDALTQAALPAITGVTGALTEMADAITATDPKNLRAALVALGDTAATVGIVIGGRMAGALAASTAAKLASVSASGVLLGAEVAGARASAAAAAADVIQKRAAEDAAIALLREAQAHRALTGATLFYADASAKQVIASNAARQAEAARTVALNAQAAALARVGAATRIAAGSSALFSAGVAALGGPVGIAVLAIGGLTYAYSRHKQGAEEAAGAVDAFKSSLVGLSEAALEVQLADIDRQIFEAQRALERLPKTVQRVDAGGAGFTSDLKAPVVRDVANPAIDRARADLSALQLQGEATEEQIKQVRAAGQAPVIPGLPPTNEGASKLASFLDRIQKELAAIESSTALSRMFDGVVPDYARAAVADFSAAQEKVRDLRDDIADFEREAKKPAPPQAFALLAAVEGQLASARGALHLAQAEFRVFGNGLNELKGNGTPNLTPVTTLFYDGAGNARELKIIGLAAAQLNQEITENAQAWADAEGEFSAYTSLGRGLADVADRLGDVGSEAGRAIGSVVDLVEALDQMKKAGRGGAITGIPDLANIGALLTGGVGAIAAGVSIISSIGGALGIGGGPSPLEQAIERNREALERHRLELSGFRLTFETQDAIGAGIDALIAQRGAIENRGGGFLGRATTERQLDYVGGILDDFGLTLAQINAAAERYGVDLYDDAGRIVIGQLEILAGYLDSVSLSVTEFGKTLDGQRALLDARREILDLTDPGALLADELSVLLAGLSSDVEARFGLAGLDLSGAEGQAALNAALTEIFEAFQAGALTGLDLSGFETVEDFLAALTGTDRALDAFGAGLEDATEKLTNIPPLFDLTLRRIEAGRAGAGAGPMLAGPSYIPPTTPRDAGPTTRPPVNLTVQITEARSAREQLREQARLFREAGEIELADAYALASA